MKVDEYPLLCKKQNILHHFDFAKVKRTMDFLKWEWYIQGRLQIPNISQLKFCANRLLDNAIKHICDGNSKAYNATGGFVAEYQNGNLSLSFQVESYEELVFGECNE